MATIPGPGFFDSGPHLNDYIGWEGIGSEAADVSGSSRRLGPGYPAVVGAIASGRSTTAGVTSGDGDGARWTTKRLPRPGSLSAAIVPPWVAAMRRATARPRPTPG